MTSRRGAARGRFPHPRKETFHDRTRPVATRRVVFQYLVPVHVEIEDGLVVCVTIIDETPVRDPSWSKAMPATCRRRRRRRRRPAWPSWRFGY
jgi:hypothetical protein